ncbi:hypothetical protein FRC07_002248 [Ceratobasidium sp. 392]|nr:hypothetical protein FRC07_002248 [Ceratobasidium sp. 392]
MSAEQSSGLKLNGQLPTTNKSLYFKTEDGLIPLTFSHCLRKDLQAYIEAYEHQSKLRKDMPKSPWEVEELSPWKMEQYKRADGSEIFEEMLTRFSIYPNLTGLQKHLEMHGLDIDGGTWDDIGTFHEVVGWFGCDEEEDGEDENQEAEE